MAIIKNILKDNYTIIPNKIIDASLTPQAFKLLVHLYKLPSNWEVRQENLAKQLGISDRSINEHIKQLKEAGWIDVEKVNNDGNFEYIYTLFTEPQKSANREDTPKKSAPKKSAPKKSAPKKSSLLINTNTLQRLININTKYNKVKKYAQVVSNDFDFEITELPFFTDFDIEANYLHFLLTRGKSKNTNAAVNGHIKKLSEFTKEEIVIALNESVQSSWTGVFPKKIKQEKKSEHETKMKGLMNV